MIRLSSIIVLMAATFVGLHANEYQDLQGMETMLGVVGLVAALVFLLPFIFYLITLQKALSRVAPQRRLMSPGLVWLTLIPLFGIVWQFFVVARVSGSLKAELEARGIAQNDACGWPIGLTMCILSCCSIIPLLGMFCAIAALILWIVYWVIVANRSAQIARPA